MLPFIEIPTLHVGPLPIQPFGLLVAAGVLLGTSVSARYTNHYKGSEDDLRFLGMRVIVFGFIACHLLDVFFYTPGKVLEDPLVIFRVWEGIASYGGVVGATLAFTYYAKKYDLHYLRYGDSVVYGLVLGFTFGRMGCATAHDHLGQQTDFPLAVQLPDLLRCPELTLPKGGPDYTAMAETAGCQNWRLPNGIAEVSAHDLGLYEVFICATLFLVLTLIVKFWKTRRPGTLLVVSAFVYPPIRFGLDFLRFPGPDPLYLGLTPAQHLCIWTVVGGFVVLRAMRKPYNKSLFFEGDEGKSKTFVAPPKPDESGKSKTSAGTKSKPKTTKAKVVRKKRK